MSNDAGARLADAAVTPRRPGAAQLALLCLGFTVLALAIFWPALDGDFVSDDIGYIVSNPYVHQLSPRNVLAILDPWGEPALYTINWAPVHLLAHALEWSFFGADTTGYHVVNVLLHALTATLLVALLLARGFPPVASGLAGLVFVVHPANVEAVAWIFQLKTIGALALATGALLLFPRRPGLGTLLFALALLCKAAALFALPVALAFAWVHGAPGSPWRRHARWLGLWALLAVVYAGPQFFAFRRTGWAEGALHPDLGVHLRTMAAIGARYLVMAASGRGAAAFHEPPRALSWTDPWWLAGLAFGLLLAARLLVTLVRRQEEAAWWIWALAAWAPISQVFTFKYPMADRYLYTILPGLLGAGLLVARELWNRLDARTGLRWPTQPARLALAAAGALVLAAWFGLQSHARASVWRSETTVTLDTVLHYPDGIAANVMRASRAAREGDGAGAAAAARRAFERGFDRFFYYYDAPEFGLVLGHPSFQAVVREMAGAWIDAVRTMPAPTQADLRVMAHAHLVRGETSEAMAVLEQALALGGGFDELVRAELGELRAGQAPTAAPSTPEP